MSPKDATPADPGAGAGAGEGRGKGRRVSGGEGRRISRLVALGILLAAAVSFVLENDQAVRVRLWFVTGHPRLIWVLVVTVVAGAVIGYLIARPARRRRAWSRHDDSDSLPARRRRGRGRTPRPDGA